MSNEIKNVNVAFECLLQAADEFSGFVLGMPEGDVISQIFDKEIKAKEDLDKLKKDREVRKLFSSILDRTNGGTSLSEMYLADRNAWKAASIELQKTVSIIHAAASAYSPSDASTGIGPNSDFIQGQMNAVLLYSDPAKINRSIKEPPPPPEPPASGSAATPAAAAAPAAPTPQREVNVSSSGDGNLDQKPPVGFNSNVQVDVGAGFSKTSPSFGAVVIKDPAFGINSRNAGHMPVFLSAVTPLEMSRCTPYLDVKVITRKSSDSKFNPMGIYHFLRIGEGGPKEDESDTFFNPSPGGELEKFTVGSFYNYMDIFTSPQTMVNSDINRIKSSGNIASDLKAKFNFNGNDDLTNFQFSDVKDPLQPFMTLIDFNVSIEGSGHGLLATKKANLKIKLHDKSRIKDLAPILSPTLFSSTKFSIEFGWSHPDGDVTSTNIIGKYLNALRDNGIYQLVSADYSFGKDSSVDIDLKLVCSGFQQMNSISAACGIVTGLDVIIDDLSDAIDSYIKKNASSSNKNIKFKNREIRSQLKVSHTDLSKNSTFVEFQRIANIREKIDKLNTSDKDQKELFLEILQMIYGQNNIDQDTVDKVLRGESLDDATKKKLDTSSNTSVGNAGDIIYAKLRSLPYGIDPFRGQVINHYVDKVTSASGAFDQIPLIGVEGKYKASGQQDYISLGKIISMFVGYPMAASQLYDEVQLVFYPVNTQSGAARRHTTASLPIKFQDLENEINKRFLASEGALRDLSVGQFFGMLDRLVSNPRADVYGVYSSGVEASKLASEISKEIEAFNKETFEKQVELARVALGTDAVGSVTTELNRSESFQKKDDKAKEELINKAIIDEYLKVRKSAEKDNVDLALSEAYAKDGLKDILAVDDTRFTTANLTMFFETFPLRKFNPTLSDSQNLLQYIGRNFDVLKRRDLVDNGIIYDKTVLRIHIYDSNSNLKPDLVLLGSDLNTSDPKNQELYKKFGNNYSFLKSLLMMEHPTIIHGSSTGVINDISFSANTSGQMANVYISEAAGAIYEGEENSVNTELFDETIMLPGTIQLDMMGFPMLTRGQQIYIDFGTQTTIDNIYTVKTVSHTVSQGTFTTSSTLVPANPTMMRTLSSKLKSLFT